MCILITIALVSVKVSTSPVEFHQGVSHPEYIIVRRLVPRAQVEDRMYSAPVKGHPQHEPPFTGLRKGEYICGNRICKLKPGEIPKGCNGICQYPIL